MTSPTSPPKLIKWPTYLSITTDALLAPQGSEGYVHTMNTTLFDSGDRSVMANLSVWSRNTPIEGTTLLTNVAIATNPLRLVVPDAAYMRAVPEEFDGAVPSKPCLPAAAPVLSGIGVIKQVSKCRKRGVIGGLVFLDKAAGWVEYWLNVEFEDLPQWSAWLLSAPSSLVTFDAVLARVDEDGTVHANWRRMSYICDAHRVLLQALGMGTAPPSDRAAKIAEFRQNVSKAKRARDEDRNSNTENGDNASTSDISTSPSKSPTKAAAEPPSSPTPAPTLGKRTRVDRANHA